MLACDAMLIVSCYVVQAGMAFRGLLAIIKVFTRQKLIDRVSDHVLIMLAVSGVLIHIEIRCLALVCVCRWCPLIWLDYKKRLVWMDY